MPGSTYCSVSGCMNNSRQQKQLVFFRMPTQEDRVAAWCKLIGRMDIMSKKNPHTSRVCSVHFESSMYVNKRLKSYAVPTLDLPPNTESIDLPPIKPEEESKTLLQPKGLNITTPFKISSRIVYEEEEFNFPELCAPESVIEYNLPDSTESTPINNSKPDQLQLQEEEVIIKTDPSDVESDDQQEECTSQSCNSETESGNEQEKMNTNNYNVDTFVEEGTTIKSNSESADPLAERQMYIGVTIKAESEDENESASILGFEGPEQSAPHIDKVDNSMKPVVTYLSKRKNKSVDIEEKHDAGVSTLPELSTVQPIDNKKQQITEPTLKLKKVAEELIPEQFKILANNTSLLKRKQETETTGNQKSEGKKIKTNDLKQKPVKPPSVRGTFPTTSGLNHILTRWQKRLNSKYKGDVKELENQLLGLNLYLTSPQVYEYLLHVINLPPLSTIEKIKLDFKPGVCDDIITILTKRLENNPPNYKYCTLTMSEMELKTSLSYDVYNDDIVGFTEIDGVRDKEIVKYALFVSIRGCIVDYKQPLGYAFTGVEEDFEGLSAWLYKIIRKLNKAGFIVCALVTHEGYFFSNFSKSMNVRKESPFFQVDDKKVFYIFDALHLIKDLQRNLFICNFSYDGEKVVSWRYIKDFYDKDIERKIRMAPKLTDLHLDPNKGEDLRYGPQLLSYSVAAGMYCAMEMGHLPSEAEDTIDFILKVDRLFDILNSNKEDNPNEYKRSFSGAKSQVKCLNDWMEIFKSLQAFTIATDDCVTSSVKAFASIQVTINAILQLHTYFVSEGIKSFPTKLINLDANRTYFKAIQVSKVLIHASVFKRSFSQLLTDSLFKNPDELSSAVDLERYLDIEYSDKSHLYFKSQLIQATSPSLALSLKDFIRALPRKTSFGNACTILLQTCLKSHACPTLKKHLESKSNNMTASTVFMSYVRLYENGFVKHFEDMMLGSRICERLSDILHENTLLVKKPCRCFPFKQFIVMYTRMRIHHALKCTTGRTSKSFDEVYPIYVDLNPLR